MRTIELLLVMQSPSMKFAFGAEYQLMKSSFSIYEKERLSLAVGLDCFQLLASRLSLRKNELPINPRSALFLTGE